MTRVWDAPSVTQILVAQPEMFKGRGGFVEFGHFDKHFAKNTREEGPSGKNFGLFSPRYS